MEEGGGGGSEGPRFPGERRVSLAREGDSNGHQASFQTERKGAVKKRVCGGGVESREVMKTIHPSLDVSDKGREKEGLKFWKLSLNCVNQSRGRGAASLSFSLCVDLLYRLLSFTSVLEQAESIYVNKIQLNQLDMRCITACSHTKDCAQPEPKRQNICSKNVLYVIVNFWC